MAKTVAKKSVQSSVLPKGAHELMVEKRSVLGRKVKKLRRQGLLPANVYGRDMKSLAIQTKINDFDKVYEMVGETGLVGLKINGDTYPVLIHNVARNPVTDDMLHVDFLRVNLAEKVTATVPVEITGEPPAERAEEGVVVQQMHEIEVEALPTELPEKIVVDVSGLTEVDAAIKVSDLKAPSGVEIKDDPERIVVNIAPPAKEEEVTPPAETAEGEVPAMEGERGAPQAVEGETPTEEAAEAPAEKGDVEGGAKAK